MSFFPISSFTLFVLLFSLSVALQSTDYVFPVSERQAAGYRKTTNPSWRFSWPVKRSLSQPRSAPGPRCFNHCKRARFWRTHAFIYNTELSDDFYRYSGKPNPKKWVVTDPFTHNRGQWYGRQPGAFIPENVFIVPRKWNNLGGLTIRAKAFPKDTPRYEAIFRRVKARSDKTLEDHGYEEYTMGMVSSKKAVRYGYFETESRIMPIQIVNSFWMSSKINGRFEEIDVYENSHVSGQESQWNVDMRWYSVGNAHASRDRSATVDPGNLITAKPPWYKHWEHIQKRPVTYGLLWTPNIITWFVNGLPYTSVANKHWNQPMFIRFDVETNYNWHGILPNMWKLHNVPQYYSIYYFRAWGIRYMKPDPAWQPVARQTVHDIVDEAMINGVVRAKKAGDYDPTTPVVVADGESKVEADWKSGEAESTTCTDVDKKNIPGLQSVATDPSALARHPFRGETLGQKVRPPYGLTTEQFIKTMMSKDDYVSWVQKIRYWLGWA